MVRRLAGRPGGGYRALRDASAVRAAILMVPLLVLATSVGHAGDYRDGMSPRINYLLHCAGCHLPDGTGSPPEVPSLHGEIGTLAGLPEGRRYLARVPGASQAPISDDDLARVLNWVLKAFNAASLPAEFEPYSGAEVGDARRHVLADPVRERARIWRAYDIEKR